MNNTQNDIPFNRPSVGSNELQCVEQAIKSGGLSGGGNFTRLAQNLLKNQLNIEGEVLLTTSCTHALEVAAILLNLVPGDEVIVPSFTFPSTALAFVMHGATVVFADCRSDTMNIDASQLEQLITPKTKAIVPVHYAGVACDMDDIMAIAKDYSLIVIEDNAHGLFGRYKNKFLGGIGHIACQSFHETKNISCGEGGALIINDRQYLERAEIILEKGTNRKRFFRGLVDKYSWVDKGSSYILSDVLAAMLFAQLKRAEEIQLARKHVWEYYFRELAEWSKHNNIRIPFVPDNVDQGYHMFYLIMPDMISRDNLLAYLNNQSINAVFHYLPLDTSKMGRSCSREVKICTTSEQMSQRLLRLPFYTDLNKIQQKRVVDTVKQFSL